MVTQVYITKANEQISLPAFTEDGRVFVTFVPSDETLHIESDQYISDPIVSVATSWTESKTFLDTLKDGDEDTV